MLTAPTLWLEATPTAEGFVRWRRGERSLPVLATALHHAALLGLRGESDALLAAIDGHVRRGAEPLLAGHPAAEPRIARALPLLPPASVPDSLRGLPPTEEPPTSLWIVRLDIATLPGLEAVARANGTTARRMAARIVEAGGVVPDPSVVMAEPMLVEAPTRAWGTLALAADMVGMDIETALAGTVAAAVRRLRDRIS